MKPTASPSSSKDSAPDIEAGRAAAIPSRQAVFGCDESALVAVGKNRLHHQVVEPLERLVAAAAQAGFDLQVASGYRSFERQRGIWTAKALGERPVLDDAGQPLDIRRLDDAGKVHAILRWSALPGTSRHHWGTDMDVFDRRSLGPDGRLALTREECESGGPLYRFHTWLTRFLAGPDNPGFYRPYDRDRGGVAPEPWHLSYAPLANRYAREQTLSELQAFLEGTDLELKEAVLELLPTLYDRYVTVPEGASGESVQ